MWKPVSMKQFAWPSYPRASFSPSRKRTMLRRQHLRLEIRHRSGLRDRQVGGVAEREDVGGALMPKRVLVGGHEAELVAQRLRPRDEVRAAMQRRRDEQVERGLALVVGPQHAGRTVDLGGPEAGDQLDLLVREQRPRAEPRRPGLVKAPVERRGIGQLDPVADASFAKVPVGEEGELERCERALDRHVDEVHDETTAVEPLEPVTQRLGTGQRVEGECALVPSGPRQPRRLLRAEPRARRDDEHVVGEELPAREPYLLPADGDRCPPRPRGTRSR